MKVIRIIAIAAAALLSLSARAGTLVNVEPGFAKDGKPTTFWMEAIRGQVSTDVFALITERKRKPSAQETAWAKKIGTVVPLFKKELPSLSLPFASGGPLEKIALVLGNQGGKDAFTCSPEHICLDLNQWVQNYGDPIEPEVY